MIKKTIPFIFVLLWSTGFIGTKYGLAYASMGDFLTLRMVGNLLVFALLITFIKQEKLNNKQIFHAMMTGLFIHGAYLSGVFGAIEMGLSAGLTAIIVGLQPLLTAVFAMLILKERLSLLQWGALALGIIGLMLVVSGSLQFHDVSFKAIGLAVLGLLGITIGTIYQKKFCQQQALLPSVFWQYIASLLIFLPIALLQQGSAIQWQPEFIFSLIWLILGLSVTAILLLLYMIEQGDAAKVTSYFYLVPPVTAIEAWLLFDESLSQTSLMGMVLCALSVFVVIKSSSKKVDSGAQINNKLNDIEHENLSVISSK